MWAVLTPHCVPETLTVAGAVRATRPSAAPPNAAAPMPAAVEPRNSRRVSCDARSSLVDAAPGVGRASSISHSPRGEPNELRLRRGTPVAGCWPTLAVTEYPWRLPETLPKCQVLTTQDREMRTLSVSPLCRWTPARALGSSDDLVAERRPCVVEPVDGEGDDALTLADRHLQQALDVHSRIGERAAELGHFAGLVRALHQQGGPLGELDSGALQSRPQSGLVTGREQDGAMVPGHHTGQLEVDAALGADISQASELARLVLELDAEQVHGDLPSCEEEPTLRKLRR